MNLTLSISPAVAEKAKKLATREGKSLSAWFRERIERETEEVRLTESRGVDSKTAALIGAALPLEEHWEDARWRRLAEKHLR